jgi:hypothetical protein
MRLNVSSFSRRGAYLSDPESERELTSSIRASAPLADYSNNDNHQARSEFDDFPQNTHAMNVVPTFNEGENIAELIGRVGAVWNYAVTMSR